MTGWHDRSDRRRETPIRRTSLELAKPVEASLADHPSRPAAIRSRSRPDTRKQPEPMMSAVSRSPCRTGAVHTRALGAVTVELAVEGLRLEDQGRADRGGEGA